MGNYLEAALVADSLSLGPHWVYDQDEILRAFPEGVGEFADPMSEYHPQRSAGEQTHYGDQAIMLNHSIRRNNGFDAELWKADWLAEMAGFNGYVDGASRATLAAGGEVASDSSDLGGASRMAAILDEHLSLHESIAAGRKQAGLSHGDAAVGDAAEFFVRAVYHLRKGETMYKALLYAAEEGEYTKLAVGDSLRVAREQHGDDFRKAGEAIGQGCGVDSAFPLTLMLALREGMNFPKVISRNALIGGDSAARAMMLALLFEARDGKVAQPYLDGLKFTNS